MPETDHAAEILSRLHNLDDDGHAIKLGRATAVCEQISRKYEDKDWLTIKGDDTWSKIYHLIVDSAEAPGQRWVRTAGLDEAWNVGAHLHLRGMSGVTDIVARIFRTLSYEAEEGS